MHLTLIKPNIGRMEHSLYVDEGRMEPLPLGVLAGMISEDVDMTLFDDRCEAILYDQPTDLMMITVETYTARRSYEIADEYRKRGVPVVMGGFHPTLIPDEVMHYCDCMVTGDAESIMDQLISDFRNGKLKKRYDGVSSVPQANILPRRDLFEGKGYLPITLLQFGRGCRFACKFCAISSYFGRKHYARRIDEVVREIELQNRRFLFFVDDNIVSDREAAKALFKALIPLKLSWVSQASIDMTQDLELMDLMAESGCLGHVIGFESIRKDSLKEMKKAPAFLAGIDQYDKQVQILRSYGLQTWAAFTLGYDHDTPESLYDALDFAKHHKFTFAAWNILMPYPGTPLYDQLAEQDRHLYDGKWWLHPEYRFNHAAFKPAQMSPDELTEISFDIRSKWNSIGSLLNRFLEPATNLRNWKRMGVFWRYNPLFRKEVFKKQGMRFGLSTK